MRQEIAGVYSGLNRLKRYRLLREVEHIVEAIRTAVGVCGLWVLAIANLRQPECLFDKSQRTRDFVLIV
jgi:hypothetical protein